MSTQTTTDGFTCWTSHLCSVEMEMGRCCWSRSWRRHSERTKWTRLQKQYPQDSKAKREREEERSCYAVQTPIYASYYVTGVRAFRIIFPFFCVPKARDFSLLRPLLRPALASHVSLPPHNHESVSKLWPGSNKETAKQQRFIGPVEKRCNYCSLEQVIRGKWNC